MDHFSAIKIVDVVSKICRKRIYSTSCNVGIDLTQMVYRIKSIENKVGLHLREHDRDAAFLQFKLKRLFFHLKFACFYRGIDVGGNYSQNYGKRYYKHSKENDLRGIATRPPTESRSDNVQNKRKECGDA